MNDPLNWDMIADIYDKNHSGRKARTLPMAYIAEWAESRTDIFSITENGDFILKVVSK